LKIRSYIVLALAVGGCFTRLQAQEAIRMSLASAEAAEARRKAASTIGYYNLKLGPTAWRFGASLGLEYNDNVVLTEDDKEGDLIFRPQVNAQLLWPITEKNAINLNVGAGYSVYVEHPELSRIYITPGSELSFDLYAGDAWINLHDRFSITQDSYQDPTVTGNGNYSRLENALGVAVTWDLNKIILRGGYDHVDYVGLSGNGSQPDGRSELVSSSLGYSLMPGMYAGVELGGGLLHYTGTNVVFSEAKQWNAGVFFESQLSQYMHFRGSVGYTVYSPENGRFTNAVPGSTNSVSGSVEDFTGVYAQIDLRHRLNEYVAYTLTGGRSISFAFYGGSVDLTYAHLLANWKIVRKVGINTSLDYEHGTQGSFFGETFDRYGASINFSRAITKKASGSLGYQFYWRTSDLIGRDYTANIISLNFNYTF